MCQEWVLFNGDSQEHPNATHEPIPLARSAGTATASPAPISMRPPVTLCLEALPAFPGPTCPLYGLPSAANQEPTWGASHCMWMEGRKGVSRKVGTGRSKLVTQQNYTRYMHTLRSTDRHQTAESIYVFTSTWNSYLLWVSRVKPPCLRAVSRPPPSRIPALLPARTGT